MRIRKDSRPASNLNLQFDERPMEILGDSKITGKFQATVPRAVRRLLALGKGDRIVFVMEHDHVAVRKGRLEVQV